MERIARVDDDRHRESSVEEWVFAAWTPDAALGMISGHRIVDRRAWYWAALARVGRPLLHMADFDVPVRADPFIVKGEALWAEHICDEPMAQWTIGNETYASAIDDPDDALGRAYGDPTAIAFDLEWYATSPPTRLEATADRSSVEFGYEQRGVVHGAVDVLGEPRLEFAEIPAHRWHRWTTQSNSDPSAGPAGPTLGPLLLPVAVAHTGVRAPFAFPDGSVSDLVLGPDGWRRRGTERGHADGR